MATEISAQKLVETGAHFGHQMRRWNPRMREYLYKVQDNTFIFDLIKTKSLLSQALEFLSSQSKDGKAILFVGTKKQSKEKVMEVAKETGSFYITERWLGGVFTNFDQIKRSLHKMEDMKKKLENGEYANYTKKERLLISRDIEKLERMIGGLAGMERIPECVIIVDTHKEGTAVAEANALNVPIVGIVDSNATPDPIDFPIPMNDDATAAVGYVLELMRDAILSGKSTPKAAAKAPAKAKKTPKAKKAEETK